jgi:hypothetical protein
MTHSPRCFRHSLWEIWSEEITCFYLTRKGNGGESVGSNEGGNEGAGENSDVVITNDARNSTLIVVCWVYVACPQLFIMTWLKLMQNIWAGGLPMWYSASSVNFHNGGSKHVTYFCSSGWRIDHLQTVQIWASLGRRREFQEQVISGCLRTPSIYSALTKFTQVSSAWEADGFFLFGGVGLNPH